MLELIPWAMEQPGSLKPPVPVLPSPDVVEISKVVVALMATVGGRIIM